MSPDEYIGGFIFQNNKPYLQERDSRKSPAHKLDQTMGLDTQLNYRGFLTDSMSAGLLRTGNALYSKNQGRRHQVRSCMRHASDPSLAKGQEHMHTHMQSQFLRHHTELLEASCASQPCSGDA